MKLLTLALVALLVPSIAAANPRGDRRAARRAQILEKFDANRDGQLDRDEKRTAKTAIRAMRMQKRAARFERLIQRFDRNGDGNLGPGEVPPHATKKLQRLDRDGDGWVRPDEMRMPPQRGHRMRRDAPPARQAPPSQGPDDSEY